jgi:Uma2 family endonuclease
MTVVAVPDEQRLRLSFVSWNTYLTYSNALGDRPIRVTYDRGEMEILSPSSRHENRKRVLGRLVEALAEVLGIDIASYGSTTFRREDLERAVEPDECYWIQNEKIVRGRDDIDIAVDPPPDLAIEIEVSRSTLKRMNIDAALGVPEVWRWDGQTDFSVWLLTPRSACRESQRSKSFPFLPLEEFTGFLTWTGISETQHIRSFRTWVRKRAKQGWK